jgi:hypothetical protein
MRYAPVGSAGSSLVQLGDVFSAARIPAREHGQYSRSDAIRHDRFAHGD